MEGFQGQLERWWQQAILVFVEENQSQRLVVSFSFHNERWMLVTISDSSQVQGAAIPPPSPKLSPMESTETPL